MLSLTPCRDYTVQENHVMVLGDNRVVSADSRIMGFVNLNDIEGVIKSDQKPTPTDKPLRFVDDEATFSLDPTIFVELLNDRRTHRDHPLELDTSLNQIATQRSRQIAASSDHTIPDLGEALKDNDYSYILIQDVLTYGFLSEQELVEHILQNPRYRDEFLSDRYYKLGVGVSMADDGACRYPVINIILSWPTEPRYGKNVT